MLRKRRRLEISQLLIRLVLVQIDTDDTAGSNGNIEGREFGSDEWGFTSSLLTVTGKPIPSERSNENVEKIAISGD